MAIELAQVLLFFCLEKVHHLGESFDCVFGLVLLFRESGGHAFHIVVAIFVVVEAKLPHRAVVDNSPVHQNIVAIPLEPAKNVLGFKEGADAGKNFGHLTEEVVVALVFASRFRPLPVGDLAVDMVVGDLPQLFVLAFA